MLLQAYKNEVYLLPKELHDKVAYLRHPVPSAMLTDLTQEQAHHTRVNVEALSKVRATVAD